ncbi:MAG: acyltransferase [Spirochaetales bacterium]|nr:acyltransferase [Spirochaetales bacterium]
MHYLPSHKKNRNPYIEVLRFAAISFLLIYHSVLIIPHMEYSFITKALQRFGMAGWIGTDLFLVIAGYFCSEQILEFQHVGKSYGSYVLKRFLRIAPPYFLFLTVYLLAGLKLIHYIGLDFQADKVFLPFLFFFSANIPLAFGHWSGIALEGMFSLSLLFQLTLLFGAVLFLVKDSKKILIILLAAEVAAIVLRMNWHSGDLWRMYFFTFSRMDAFIAGILLSRLRHKEPSLRFLQKRRGLLFALASLSAFLVFILTGGLNLSNPLTHQIAYPVLGFFGFAMLNFSADREDSNRVINQIALPGKYSFTLYLIKLPMVYVSVALSGIILPAAGAFPLFVLTFLFVFASAAFFHQFFSFLGKQIPVIVTAK